MQMEAARGGGLDTGRRELKPSFSPVSSYLLSKLPVVGVGVCLCVCVRACVDRDTWLAAVHGVTKSRTEPLNKGPRLKKGPPQWAFEVRLSQSPPFFSCLGTTSVQEYGGGGGEADPWPRQEHRRSALGGERKRRSWFTLSCLAPLDRCTWTHVFGLETSPHPPHPLALKAKLRAHSQGSCKPGGAWHPRHN